MKGAYDDLSQEMWGRADDDMPQDYLDAILAQCTPKCREPQNNAELKAFGDELKAIEGRVMGRRQPRFGQPAFDAPLIEWYREYRYRILNPLWYEREYHYTDDGREIHQLKGVGDNEIQH